jgi:hypothetical protein
MTKYNISESRNKYKSQMFRERDERKERKSFLFISDEQTQNVSQLHGVALSMGSNNSPN